jgi:hypothetical protein
MILNERLVARSWLSGEVFFPEYERFEGSRHYRFEATALLQSASLPQGRRLPWLIEIANMIGIGVRYARGQDYYNLQFVRDIDLFQFVVVVDPWSPWL